MTLPVGIQLRFFVQNMSPQTWLYLLAAAFLSAIPGFLVFMGLQRWMVSGSTAGAVKGKDVGTWPCLPGRRHRRRRWPAA